MFQRMSTYTSGSYPLDASSTPIALPRLLAHSSCKNKNYLQTLPTVLGEHNGCQVGPLAFAKHFSLKCSAIKVSSFPCSYFFNKMADIMHYSMLSVFPNVKTEEKGSPLVFVKCKPCG